MNGDIIVPGYNISEYQRTAKRSVKAQLQKVANAYLAEIRGKTRDELHAEATRLVDNGHLEELVFALLMQQKQVLDAINSIDTEKL
jgi:hypothetical protein